MLTIFPTCLKPLEKMNYGYTEFYTLWCYGPCYPTLHNLPNYASVIHETQWVFRKVFLMLENLHDYL